MTSDQVPDNKFNCNLDLEQALRSRLNIEIFRKEDYKPEFDQDLIFLKDIMACPRNEMVNLISEFQNKHKNDFELASKSSYLLIKLGTNITENGKKLVFYYSIKEKELLNKNKESKPTENLNQNKPDSNFDSLEYLLLLEDVISHDDPNLLSEAFELCLKLDGALSEYFAEMCAKQFLSNPEAFLLKLKPISKKIRGKIIFFIFYAKRKEVILQSLNSISSSSPVSNVVQEIRDFAKNNKYGL